MTVPHDVGHMKGYEKHGYNEQEMRVKTLEDGNAVDMMMMMMMVVVVVMMTMMMMMAMIDD